MSWADLSNASFEFFGALMVLRTVVYAWQCEKVVGVHWMTPLFFWSWGAWNVFYYPHLDQWASFVAGVFLFGVNTVWIATVFILGRRT